MLFNFQGTIPRKTLNGGVAQLGERLPCKQEVMGSTPTISTIWENLNNGNGASRYSYEGVPEKMGL